MASLISRFESNGLQHLSILESRACAKPHKNLKALKNSLEREWKRIPQEVLSAAAENFYKRLSLCIKAKGDVFEGLE